MGNEKSQPSGLTIDDVAIEVTDNWSLHGATYSVGSIPKISVFTSTCTESKPNGINHLDKFTKNVMIYRHPCILKYVASWKKGNKFHLATEQVQPLAQVLPSQTLLQICVGLQNILKALIFLHESGSVSHNNVCQSAIYVSQGGSWKLGGLQYLCRFSELKSSYLEEIGSSRYDPAIAPNEGDSKPSTSVDAYAFGVLVQEVLSRRNTDDVPGMADFLDICKNQLQNSSSQSRPTLSSLLNHPFFSHEFLMIHNFLVDLPIKKDSEKQEFFRSLVLKLKCFPEEIVASQLGSLMLSRMVLLDPTAQSDLLPHVFIPRKEETEIGVDSLFSESTFKTHMIPRLLPLFCVRDVHIRLILLSSFNHYCSYFSQVQLQTRILPELLVGIKDTNDILVSATLRALSELVPVLGGAVVIGGSRAKLFADGRPKAVESVASSNGKLVKTEMDLTTEVDESDVEVSGVVLPERASPDGGEYVPSLTNSEEEETWPEWDCKTNEHTNAVIPVKEEENLEVTKEKDCPKKTKVTIGLKEKVDEVEDIFRDMEPVILKPQIIHVEERCSTDKFAFSLDVNEGTSDGWGDDFEDWNLLEGSTENVKTPLEDT